MAPDNKIMHAIDTHPLNRGITGAEWLKREGNIPVVMGDDLALFEHEGDGAYEVHFIFASRGREAIAAAKSSFKILFEKYGAVLIIGLVPDFRRDVKMLARWAGGKFIGTRATSEGPCDIFVLSKEMWSHAK